MALLDTWTRGEHTDAAGTSHPTYRKGEGPGVVLIHEIPGISPDVIAYAEDLVAAGYTVVMPHLFGTPEAPVGARSVGRALAQICVSREMSMLAAGRTTPVAGWLRSLARELHEDVGGPGVGALGMCFTGGFALAMMVDYSVAAPVLAQPSTPFPLGRRRAADLQLSPADLDVVRERAAAGCSVLGLRYEGDRMIGTRFETLTRELGDAFLRVDLPGSKHSTLTLHRHQEAVDAVLAFFDDRLRR